MNAHEFDRRLDAARALMREQNVDVLALGPTENMTYLLGFHPHPDERPCILFVTQDAAELLMPALNAEESRQFTTHPMTEWSDDDGPAVAMGTLARSLHLANANAIALDETMRTDFALLLMSHAPNATFSDASAIIGHLRMRKSTLEHDVIEANARVADAAMEAAFAAIQAGVTERDVADAASAAFKAHGAERINFTIIASGPNGAFPHHHTAGRVLEAGDLVVLDIGAHLQRYNSDITRMASIGTPSDRQLEVLSTVEAAVRAALAAVRPGVPAMEVDAAARNVIRDAGFGPYFVHRTGHGLGLTGHEPPYITATNPFILEEGMTFSIEPGIYLPGEFGVRLEEIVRVTADGVAVFSRLPRTVHVAS